MKENKSFFSFLKMVYGSFEGQVIALTAIIYAPMFEIINLYSPSDFQPHSTFNGWWILLSFIILWIHGIVYLIWREMIIETGNQPLP